MQMKQWVIIAVNSSKRRGDGERHRDEDSRMGTTVAGAESKAKERHTRIINTGMLQPIKYLQRHFPLTP